MNYESEAAQEITSVFENVKKQFKIGGDKLIRATELPKFLRQTECDAVGVAIDGDCLEVHLVEVAYHKSGLHYTKKTGGLESLSSAEERTAWIVALKLVRDIMCAYIAFGGTKKIKVHFMSPVAKKAVADAVREKMGLIDDLFKPCKTVGKVDVLIDVTDSDGAHSFSDEVHAKLKARLKENDINEIYMRSCQLYRQFEVNKERQTKAAKREGEKENG